MKKRNRFIVGFLSLLYLAIIVIAISFEIEALMAIFILFPMIAFLFLFILFVIVGCISWIFTEDFMTFYEKLGW